MGRRGCASAMGMIKFPSSCSSPKALCNQFIDYYICSRGVFCINHIKLRNFVVITIECSIATVDRGSIMTRIYRWSMMVYSSLQAEFMVTKYDGHIHRYGALVFGKLVIYVYDVDLIAPVTWGTKLSDIILKIITYLSFPYRCRQQNYSYFTQAPIWPLVWQFRRFLGSGSYILGVSSASSRRNIDWVNRRQWSCFLKGPVYTQSKF